MAEDGAGELAAALAASLGRLDEEERLQRRPPDSQPPSADELEAAVGRLLRWSWFGLAVVALGLVLGVIGVVDLRSTRPDAPPGGSLRRGEIIDARNAYVGDPREIILRAPGGSTSREVVPAGSNIAIGIDVYLLVDADGAVTSVVPDDTQGEPGILLGGFLLVISLPFVIRRLRVVLSIRRQVLEPGQAFAPCKATSLRGEVRAVTVVDRYADHRKVVPAVIELGDFARSTRSDAHVNAGGLWIPVVASPLALYSRRSQRLIGLRPRLQPIPS